MQYEYKLVDIRVLYAGEKYRVLASIGEEGNASEVCVDVLNRFGADGWMLVDVTLLPPNDANEGFIVAWLMRPVAE